MMKWLASILIFSVTARAGTVTFNITNKTDMNIHVGLYSVQKQVQVYPGVDIYWTLNPGQTHALTTTCEVDEKICYGGWADKSSGGWGEGKGFKQACKNCCLTCHSKHDNLSKKKGLIHTGDGVE